MTVAAKSSPAWALSSKLNTEVGRDVQLDDLLKDYDAVFTGVGTYPVHARWSENEDAGVYDALPFPGIA